MYAKNSKKEERLLMRPQWAYAKNIFKKKGRVIIYHIFIYYGILMYVILFLSVFFYSHLLDVDSDDGEDEYEGDEGNSSGSSDEEKEPKWH